MNNRKSDETKKARGCRKSIQKRENEVKKTLNETGIIHKL